jgi:hypothetical protein
MSKTTTLGESQITQSTHDVVSVELVQPDDMPARVLIHWPLHGPTVVDPQRFGDAARELVKLFSEAHVKLARLRARRHFS